MRIGAPVGQQELERLVVQRTAGLHAGELLAGPGEVATIEALQAIGGLDVVALAHGKVHPDRIHPRDHGEQGGPVLTDQVADPHLGQAGNARDRRADRGVREVQPGLLELGGGGAHLVLGVPGGGLGVLDLLLAHDLRCAELLSPCELGPPVDPRGLGPRQGRLGRIDGDLELGWGD